MGEFESALERNSLLNSLEPDDLAWIAPQLKTMHLRAGDVLAVEDEPFTHVYFPQSAVLSVTNSISGGTVEVGTIGNEGMAGISAFLDGDGLPSRTFAQLPGEVKRMSAAAFAAGFDERPALRKLALRYTKAYLIQVAQTAACNRGHDIKSRCARWLLMTQDRVDGAPTFELTHQFLAFMLGVRRAGVTVAAGLLKDAGLIRYARGSITVLDRQGLEAASCECYSVARTYMQRAVGKAG
jgi:CRP-like cAMP-binding protein